MRETPVFLVATISRLCCFTPGTCRLASVVRRLASVVRRLSSVTPFSRLSHWRSTMPSEYVMTDGNGL